MGVPSLNDLAVDGTLNTNKQTNHFLVPSLDEGETFVPNDRGTTHVSPVYQHW